MTMGDIARLLPITTKAIVSGRPGWRCGAHPPAPSVPTSLRPNAQLQQKKEGPNMPIVAAELCFGFGFEMSSN